MRKALFILVSVTVVIAGIAAWRIAACITIFATSTAGVHILAIRADVSIALKRVTRFLLERCQAGASSLTSWWRRFIGTGSLVQVQNLIALTSLLVDVGAVQNEKRI